MYNAQFMLMYTNNTRNMNLIEAAMKKYNIQEKQSTSCRIYYPDIKKTPVRLEKKELKKLTAALRPKKMGFAAQMHALEEHKVNKFKTKCTWLLKENTIKEDLFSDDIMAQRSTQLFLYREYTRNFLAKAYANTIKREYYYRLFLVRENKSKFAEHKIYEVEGDPMIVGYPFTMCTEHTSIDIIREILYSRVKMIRARGGELPLELKLYNKYGKLIANAKV